MESSPDQQSIGSRPQSSRVAFRLTLILLVVAISGGVYYWYALYYKGNATMTLFGKNYEEAHTLHHSGDLNGSIDAERSLIIEAQDSNTKFHLNAMLAFDLWNRNEGNDRTEALQIYKTFLADTSSSPANIAAALDDIGFLIASRDRTFYETNFKEAPYNSFLPATSTSEDMRLVAINFFLLSDQKYPNSLANYSAAYLYSGFLTNNFIPNGMTKETLATRIQELIKRGDMSKSSLVYEPSHVARQRLYRAISMNASSRVLKNIAVQEREMAFQDALPKVGEDEESYQTRGVFMQARFFYANFLLEFYGNERISDIKLTLQKFSEATADSFQNVIIRNFFSDLATRSDSDFLKARAEKLAAVSSEFKTFLLSVGFNF